MQRLAHMVGSKLRSACVYLQLFVDLSVELSVGVRKWQHVNKEVKVRPQKRRHCIPDTNWLSGLAHTITALFDLPGYFQSRFASDVAMTSSNRARSTAMPQSGLQQADEQACGTGNNLKDRAANSEIVNGNYHSFAHICGIHTCLVFSRYIYHYILNQQFTGLTHFTARTIKVLAGYPAPAIWNSNRLDKLEGIRKRIF